MNFYFLSPNKLWSINLLGIRQTATSVEVDPTH